jgi:hypothetical protein
MRATGRKKNQRNLITKHLPPIFFDLRALQLRRGSSDHAIPKRTKGSATKQSRCLRDARQERFTVSDFLIFSTDCHDDGQVHLLAIAIATVCVESRCFTAVRKALWCDRELR